MVKYLVYAFIFFYLAVGGLIAEESVIKEFTSSEAFYKFKNSPDPNPSKMLQDNVKKALKLALERHLPNKPELVKGLGTADLEYEQVLDTTIVIAKYGGFIYEFRYTANPSKYHLIPMKYRYHRIPDEKKKQTNLPAEQDK